MTGVRARQLILQDGRVIGLRAERDCKDFFVKANKAVLLASGGYEWNNEMNRRFLNYSELFPITPTSNEGDGHIMGMEVGAAVALMDHSIFQPIYKVEGEEIEGRPFNRPISYGYPGSILVNRHGKRCCNESFYPDIGRAMAASLGGAEAQRSVRNALHVVADALTAHGFAAHAENDTSGELRIVSEHCPFGGAAVEHPVICAVDRGMVQGMLEALYGQSPTTDLRSSLPMGDDRCVTEVTG